jgi:gliding motility-associated-like protein
VSVCPATTTTYTVNANSVAGCTGSSTIAITVAPNPTVGATASPATICAGQSSVLTGTGGATYTWNPGGLNGSSVTVNPAVTTAYTVTGTSAASCTGTSQVTVNVTANPIITAVATPASLCIGDCSNLSATGATTYTWIPGNLNGTPVNVCPGSTTTYTVTGTTAGCTGSNTVALAVSTPPVITVSSPTPAICLGQCANITVTGATNCTWMPGSLSGLTVSVCPTVTTTYTLTASNAAGCDTTTTYIITVNPLPVIGTSAIPSTICAGQCSNILASGANTYQWSQAGATGDSTTFCPTVTTAYTVTGTSLAGCSSSAQVNVTVINLPGVVAGALPDTLCIGQGSQLTAGGASTYLWTPGNLNGGTVTVYPTQTTTYVVIGTSNGCTGLATVTVFVHPETQVSFISDTNNGCEDLLIHFYDLSAYPNATLLWSFGDGDTAMLTDTAEHLYTDPGEYDVSLTVIPQNGCMESLTIPHMVSVYPIPVADFILNPQPASIEYPEIHFFDQSTDAASWMWDFGEPGVQENTSLEQYPSHTYSDTGTFVVTLVVSSMGCYDTAKATLEIQPNVDVFIPNAFTPGTDALNMYFTCIGNGIDESTYKMRIYDRWGKQLFFTTQVNPGWDGAVNGKLVAQGTYVYMIDFVDVNSNEHHYKGIVNVLR